MTARPLSSYFQGSTGGPPLRLGLLLDDLRPGRAVASVVRDLLDCDFAKVELVVLDERAGERAATRRDDGRRRFRDFHAEGGLAFALYAMLDQRRAAVTDDPLAPEDVGELLAGIPSIAARAGRAGTGRVLPAKVVDRIRAADLDVIVQLGFAGLGGDVAAASRHGVWALRPGDGLRYRGGPPGGWELLTGDPVCSVVLRRLGDDGRTGPILDRATFATDPTSLARTRRMALYGSTHLMVRNLRLLHQRGWDWLAAHAAAVPVDAPADESRALGTGSFDRRPTTAEVLAWFGPLTTRRLGARLGRLVRRSDDVLHWRVAIRQGHGPGLGLDGRPDLTGFTFLESPPGHFYADPFPVERDGRRWLFVEDYLYACEQAVIACAELDDGGRPGEFRTALAEAGHLSYPMLVMDGPDAYLVPESTAESVVRVHRSSGFPDRWEVVASPFDQPAVDTTVWHADGRWWFFTTIQEPRGRAGMLMLFHAEAIDGAWTPHPLNPISQDVRNNRGGGGLFVDAGRLVRPSQNGSQGYGYSLTLNEVVTLTEADYSERPGPTVLPDWAPGLLGVHTYNRIGDIEVIDGKTARSRRSLV